MTAKAFGFATPLSHKSLEKGQLVLAQYGKDNRYFGVVSQMGSEFVLIVIASSDGEVPNELNLDEGDAGLWRIPGDLEVEPEGAAFGASQVTANGRGFVIDESGDVLARIAPQNRNSPGIYYVSLSTGEIVKPVGNTALHRRVKFFVRQAGRDERYEWLTSHGTVTA